MSETTYEEAKRCPRCGIPGDHTSTTPGKDRRGKPVSIHMIFCRTEGCRWENTSWVIQVNPDGSIPQPDSERDAMREKAFPKRLELPGDEQRIIQAIERQVQAEIQPGGGEIGGRR